MRSQVSKRVQPWHRNLIRLCQILLPGLVLWGAGGCATIRVTDPYRTATEQFLETVAAQQAISQLSMDGLRDQKVFVDNAYSFFHNPQQPAFEDLFVVAELRAKLLREGVRLTNNRAEADAILEVRSGGVGIDRYEYLLGLPSTSVLAGNSSSTATQLPVTTPELAILKNTRQRGFASVAFVAYRAKTGEMIAQSGPFIGRTLREDYWIFGFGPRTLGNIPPAEK